MHYRELFKEQNNDIRERYDLSIERIQDIQGEDHIKPEFSQYFQKVAGFILQIAERYQQIERDEMESHSLEQWEEWNHKLYEDILPENYEVSYGNPSYAVRQLGEIHGKILSFLYTEIRAGIVYAYEQRLYELTILNELFIEIYNCFEEEELPSYRTIKQIVYWYVSDYSDVLVAHRVREQVDPALSFAADILMESDLTDLSYLYRYGEYISDTEKQVAAFLNTLSEEQIVAMARTYTEGYRKGFVATGKSLEKKQTVNIRYHIGFERMIRQAVLQFQDMGLKPVIYRSAVASVNKKQHYKIGYQGGDANRQFDYDHRADNAIYLDRAFVERKLGVLRTAFEQYKELANGHAGPAVVETFGELPFIPENKQEVYQLDERQQKLLVELNNETASITNTFIIGKERSFTIISYPLPDIGEQFAEIFQEVVKINTLDYELYQKIQQTIIDALDQAEWVEILGKDDNKTNMKIQLHKLDNPATQTNFENCVADVNIPVGEVFTSPVLTGTGGVLHVSEVFLNGLQYKNLQLEFKDGKVVSYLCENFEKEEDNKNYIKENILYNHDSLPIGEFAIGTNTTAYAMAEKYKIADKLPILIAEKMGPHFAVGDTCYSFEEDNEMFNPDGKEIIAKENEVSATRKENPQEAYFGCHTDITIPYHELGCICGVNHEGERIHIIKNGRFVLAGTEILNQAF